MRVLPFSRRPPSFRNRFVLPRLLVGMVAAVSAVILFGHHAACGQLVAFYEFDGDSLDSSGNGLHATNNGMLFTQQGSLGQAVSNDGTTGRYIEVPLHAGPEVTDELTWGGWVQLNQLQYQTIAWIDGNWGRGLRVDNRASYAELSGFSYSAFSGWTEGWNAAPLRAGGVISGTPASTGSNYHFVASTYDAANKRTTLYVDDKVYQMGNSVPFGMWSWSTFQIGATNSNYENINGSIDNFFVFDKTLSRDQVDSIRTAANPRSAAQAVSSQLANRRWKLDFQDTDGRATAGIDNIVGNGVDEWNTLQVGAYASTVNSPSFSNLITTNGQSSGVSFHLVDTPSVQLAPFKDLTVAGDRPSVVQPWRWSDQAGMPVGRDGIIFNNGGLSGTSSNIDYEIRGLEPGRLYTVAVNGTQATGSGLNWQDNHQATAFDTDGDGTIDNMMMGMAQAGTFNEFTVKADASGVVRGRSFGRANGRNTTYPYWIGLSGLQIEELPVPSNNAAGQLVTGGKAFGGGPRHAYNFDVHDNGGNGGTLFDRIGGQHGTLRSNTPNGAVLQNGQMVLSGGDSTTPLAGWGELPGGLLPTGSEVTVEAWVAMRNVEGGHWRRLWAFGDEGSANGGEDDRFHYEFKRVRTDGGGRDPEHSVLFIDGAEGGNALDDGSGNANYLRITDDPWQEDVMLHSVVTVRDDGYGKSLVSVYHNGSLEYEATLRTDLVSIDNVNTWLGRDLHSDTNPTTNGRYDEFRVWDKALSHGQVRENFFYGPDWSGIRGDTNGDWTIDAGDIDELYAAQISGSSLLQHDLDGDGGNTDQADISHLVQTVLQTRSGDANLDGRVLANDASALASNWQGSSAGWAGGDFNGDGSVLASDQSLLSTNFGYDRSSELSTAAVSANSLQTDSTIAGPSLPPLNPSEAAIVLTGPTTEEFTQTVGIKDSDLGGEFTAMADPSGHLNNGRITENGSIVLNLGGTGFFDGVVLYEVFVGKDDIDFLDYQYARAYLEGLDALSLDEGLAEPNSLFAFGLKQNRIDGFADENFAEVATDNYINGRDFDTGVNITKLLPENGALWLVYQYQGQDPTLVNLNAATVPEPTSLGLTAIGMIAMGLWQQRRRRTATRQP